MLRLAPIALALLAALPLVAAADDLEFSAANTECDWINARDLPCDAEVRHAGTAGALAPCSLNAVGHRICVLSLDVGATATGRVMVPGAQELVVSAAWTPCCVGVPDAPDVVRICSDRAEAGALSCSGHADLAIDFGPPQPWGPAPYATPYAWRYVYVEATLAHEGTPYLFEGPTSGTLTRLVARVGSGADAAATVSLE